MKIRWRNSFARTMAPYAEVVGVVADMKFLLLTEDPHPIVYYSYAQRPWGAVVHVSVSGSPEASVRVIRSTVEAFDPAALHRLVLGAFHARS